jgi:predicted transcriptional regulator of viral defense system
MATEDTKMARLRELARHTEVLHARDLKPLDIPQRYLGRLCDEGLLVRTGRGLYVALQEAGTAHLGLAQAAKVVPKGVVCLLSALRFHEIGTQAPHEVWVALDRRAARPRVAYPPMRIMRFSGKALTEGIDNYDVEGVRVRVYNPAKTVADCFKYRNKVGLDVALEALREVLRAHRCTVDELLRYARVCRVARVMQPYLEALI